MKSPGFREEYKENLIVTNGKDGIIYRENGENSFYQSTPEVQAVDTMGTGSVLKEDALTIHELRVYKGAILEC
ncbi:hypothetical protein UQ64_01050 [Paenibacillus etheri]|uniref:Carbohydrate kinase PfkB domain-containing protein n=2 Tax=Paenibacillus etheri TaxID=1306852 RepID=A0A0W1AQV2_9BACL|nr:hypothetical protein UQ64_01050 [Paenibacillus etheri]